MAKKKNPAKAKTAAKPTATDAIILRDQTLQKEADKKRKKEAAPLPKDREEEELEKLVFGDIAGFHAGLRHDFGVSEEEDSEEEMGRESGGEDEDGADLTALNDDQLFFVDTGPKDASEAAALIPRPESPSSDTGIDHTPPPAWEDSDDERMTISLASHGRMRKLRETEVDDLVSGKEYSRRLRIQFERIYPPPTWAEPRDVEGSRIKRRRRDSDSASDTFSVMDLDDEPPFSAPSISTLLQSHPAALLPARKSSKLKPETLDIARLTDANAKSPSHSGIHALSFHPIHPLLLAAGFDQTLRLYHIDGKHNPPATSLYLRGTPIYSAAFHPDGEKVIAAGRRRYFHAWDLVNGSVEKVTRIYGNQDIQKSMEDFKISPDGVYIAFIGSAGSINILSGTSLQWLAGPQITGHVADVSWWADSSTLTIVNTGGEVYEYSLREKKVVHRWQDEGAVGTTRIANGGERWVAVGSGSGIVNVYDRKLSFGVGTGAVGTMEVPKPMKVLEQLVTGVSVLEFSPDTQLLCIASRGKKDALRMVHLPSCAVYKNWPTSNTPLGRVTCVRFAGRETGIVAVGNEQGRVRLFEIR
ncbi:U3 snoRNP protein [Rhizina undulata]